MLASRRSALMEESLPELLLQRLHTLVQLQHRAESLSVELAGLKRQIAHEAFTVAPSVPAPRELHGRESILIADDHGVVRAIAREILEGFGYQVGLARMNLADIDPRQRFDLVMLDVPYLNARYLSCVQQAKKIAPSASLVVCTVLPDGAARAHLRDWGVAGWVTKPYQPHALARCIREVLNERAESRSRDAFRMADC